MESAKWTTFSILGAVKKTFWRLFSHILHELVLQKQHPSFHWYDKKIKIMITMLVNKNINDDWMISIDILYKILMLTKRLVKL